jgi:hypothetical protein
MMHDPTDSIGHYPGCDCPDCDPAAAEAWLEWAERTAAEAIEAMIADDEALGVELERPAA